MTMNEYKCAKCGDTVFIVDTLDEDEQGLLLCDDCTETEENLENPGYH